jgi:hypothetical protein
MYMHPSTRLPDISSSALQETAAQHPEVLSLALALLSTGSLYISTSSSATLGQCMGAASSSDWARTACAEHSNHYSSVLRSPTYNPTRRRSPSLSTLMADQQQLRMLLSSLQQQYQRGNQDANTSGNRTVATNTAMTTRRNNPNLLATTSMLLRVDSLLSGYYSTHAASTHHHQLRVPSEAVTRNAALLQSVQLLPAVQERNQASQQEGLSSQDITDMLVSSRNRRYQGDSSYSGNPSYDDTFFCTFRSATSKNKPARVCCW